MSVKIPNIWFRKEDSSGIYDLLFVYLAVTLNI